MKPYADACDRNRDPILKVIKDWFVAPGTVLEIGSGTGQHAVYFAEHLPHVQWIASDRADNHVGIEAWIADAKISNVRGPLELDVRDPDWPVEQVEYIFSANTAHIMSWPEVEKMFEGVARVLRHQGVFCLYGPFNRNGQYTSDSNRAFDQALKSRDQSMGIRDDQALISLAKDHSLAFTADYSLPAKNRMLVWRKGV